MTYAQFSEAEEVCERLTSGGAGSGKIVASLKSLDVSLEDVTRAAPEDNSASSSFAILPQHPATSLAVLSHMPVTSQAPGRPQADCRQ